MIRKRNRKDPVKVENIHGHKIGFYEEKIGSEKVLIPSHIRRIESPKGRLYGWQFVMVRQGVYAPSFFISDRNSGPIHSLDLATIKLRIHLKSIDPRRNLPYKLKEIKKGVNKTGLAGVRMDWKFNRKRSLYELSLEARAGEYVNSRALRIYVGTEHTVTSERLSEAFRKTRDFRQFQIKRVLVGDTYKIPLMRPGRRKVGVTLEQAQKQLEDIKERHEQYLSEFVQQSWPSLNALSKITQWRRSHFTWRTENVHDSTLAIPDYIERIEDEWEISLKLPNMTLYGDRVPIGYDPEASLVDLIHDGMTQHLMAAPNLIPDDSVHGTKQIRGWATTDNRLRA